MLYFYSILLSAVQALTEFLPISSSAHLLIFHAIIKEPVLNTLAFDVILHTGTFFAVLIYFWPEVKKIIFVVFLPQRDENTALSRRLGWQVIVSAAPAALAGYFFGDFIEATFRSIHWIVWPLAGGALLLLTVEKLAKKIFTVQDLTFKQALLIGLAQVLAFIPGTSRSGITITAGMGLGFSREASARFSFLMSLPIILGASIKKIAELPLGDFSLSLIFVFVLGAAFSALFGFLVIKYFLRFVSNHSLACFAYYRLVLAMALLLVFLF